MGKPVLTGNKHYHQGKYIPKNPSKYIGNPSNIIYRSGWEKYFLSWCDYTPTVIKYGSEEMIVPYISPIDGKQHRYYIDFVIYVKQKDGSIMKFAVEIKPYSQTKAPKLPKGRVLNESYRNAVMTYEVNKAKWAAAEKICNKIGMKFIVLTEKQLLKK